MALWSLLALLTVGAAPVPPFQLASMSFLVGGLVGLVPLLRRPGAVRGVPVRVWALGICGLFGYHALYFSALRLAPAAEAGLIAYLWPLLIVIFSGLLPGERLRLLHLVGALMAFGGAALLVNPGELQSEFLMGYLLALLCALVWSGYSVLSRQFPNIPTELVSVFCLVTAVLSLPMHLVFEETVWPQNLMGWFSVLGLGLGPVGLAFYLWDFGVKRGNIQMLGTASYAAPVLSTVILVAVGVAEPTISLLLAALLIAGGAGLAALVREP